MCDLMMIVLSSTRWLTGRMAGNAIRVNTILPRDVLASSRQHSAAVSSPVCRDRVIPAPVCSSPAMAPRYHQRVSVRPD